MSNYTIPPPHFEAHISYVDEKAEITCEIINQIDWNIVCDFIENTRTCQQKSMINYLKLLFCQIPASTISFILASLVISFLTFVGYIFLASIAVFYCVPNTIAIAHYVRLNEDNTGSLVLTILNAAPHFIALIADNDYTNKDTEVNGKYGNTIASLALYAGFIVFLYPFKIQPQYLIRNELTALIVALYLEWRLSKFFIVELWVPISLICFWFIYILYILIEEILLRLRYKGQHLPRLHQPFSIKFPISLESSVPNAENKNDSLFVQFLNDVNPIKGYEFENANKWRKAFLLIGCPIRFLLNFIIPFVDYTIPNHGWSKLLNCVNIMTTALLTLIIVFKSIKLHDFLITVILAAILIIHVFRKTRTDKPPHFHIAFAFLGIHSAAIITYIVTNELYGIWYMILTINGFSKENMGILVHKWINTIIDLVVNIVIAGLGYPLIAFQSFISSTILHCTIILGIYWLMAANKDNIEYVPSIRNDHALTVTVFIEITTSMTLFAAGLTNFYMRRSIGIFLIIVYLIFVLFMVLVEFEIIHPYGTDHVS